MKNLYIFLIINFLFLSFYSCKDDDFIEDYIQEEGFVPDENGYALSFVVTLDRMGGPSTRADYYNPMEEMESYIDPEKFRVLFFDSQEQFLFESKSRWVKKESEDATSTTWYVSVPIYKYGNDADDDWEFTAIRDKLTSENFQIVLLVNRPLHEYASEYKNANGGSDAGSQSGWFDNSKPDWGKKESLYLDGGKINPSPKKIFDIHHSQEDWIYENKSAVQGIGSANNPAEGYYNFIMEGPARLNDNTNANGTRTVVMANTVMSSVTSWVDWDGEEMAGENKDKPNYKVINSSSVFKKTLLPSKSHPIPMYGTQKFSKIEPESWQKGTTFHLTRVNNNGNPTDLPVSLLRSCVKIELITKLEPEFVTLWYSNIYSRCEPMDIWTPTNEIWCHGTDDAACSEMDAIMENGPIYTTNDPGKGSALKNYQYKISWIYGSWKSKGWLFGSLGAGNIKPAGKGYPKIFNPMIQRNSTVAYGENPARFFDGSNYHIIIYTGERNINDPSKLSISNNPTTTDGGAGSRTIIIWNFKLKNDKKLYTVPITNYDVSGNPAKNITMSDYDSSKALPRGDMDTYANTVSTDGTSKTYRPWPLLRNHVYRLYMQGTKGDDNFNIVSEHSSSKTITFPEAIKRRNLTLGETEKNPVKLETSTLKNN